MAAKAALVEQCLRAKLVYGEPWRTSGPFPPGFAPAPELPQKPTQLPDIAVKVGLAGLDTPKTCSEGEPEDDEIFFSSELSVATSPSERSQISGTWQDPRGESRALPDFSPVQSPINSKPNPGLLSTSPPAKPPPLAASCATVPSAATACATSPPYPSRLAQVRCDDAGLLAQMAQGPFATRGQLATPAPLRPCADPALPSPAVPLQEQLPGPLPGSPGGRGGTGAAQLQRAWPSGTSPSQGLVLWPSSQARAPLATEPAGEPAQRSNQSRWVEAPCSAPASPLARRLMQEVGPPPGLCAPGPRAAAGLPGGCSCGGSQCGTPNGSTGGVTSSDEALPSIGSQGHPTKSCRPCHYFRTKAGCANGYNCDYCHFKHSKRSRPRLPKLQRALCRALAQLAFNKQQGGGAGVLSRAGALQALIDASASPRLASYTTSVLRSLQSGSVLQPSDLELILRSEESPASVPTPPKAAACTAESVAREVVQGLEGEVLEELCRLLQIDPDSEM